MTREGVVLRKEDNFLRLADAMGWIELMKSNVWKGLLVPVAVAQL